MRIVCPVTVLTPEEATEVAVSQVSLQLTFLSGGSKADWVRREKQVVRQQVEYWTLLYKPVISYCTVHCTVHCTDSPLTQTDRHYYAAPAFINLKFNFSHDWRFDRKTHGFVIVR